MPSDLPPAAGPGAGFAPPVFVVGSSRSGTTLLYSILLASGHFAVYEAETFMLETGPVRYGNLGRRRNFEGFLKGWLNSEQFRRSGLDADAFAEGVRKRERSYTEFLRYFMESVARAQGRSRWVEKTPSHVFHMRTLARGFPEARFIHVIRDGRDVTLSNRRLGWTGIRGGGPLTQLICAAKSWELAVRTGRREGKALGERYMEVRYEDLVCEPEAVMGRLGAFLGVTIDPERVEKGAIGALKRSNTVFGDKTGGISGGAVARWREELSDTERALLDRAIGRTLAELGYPPDRPPGTGSGSVAQRVVIVVWPRLLRLRKFLKYHTPLGRLAEARFQPAATRVETAGSGAEGRDPLRGSAADG